MTKTSTASVPSEAVILDVPFLDEFFLDWVFDRIRRILQRLQYDGAINSDIVTNYLLKFLRPVAHCAILLTTHAQTPATRLLGLHRVPNRSASAPSASPILLTRRDYYFRLITYALFSTIIPVLLAELKEWHRQRQRERLAAANRHDNERNSPLSEHESLEQLAAERKFQCAQIFLQVVSRIWPVMRLVALLGVWTGVTRTSEIAMILTGWTYQRQKNREEEPRLHVDYAQRRWVWEELLRSLRVWGQGLTLMSVWHDDWQRWKDNLFGILLRARFIGSRQQDNSQTDTLSSCCFCHSKPIVIPLKLQPCGHMACYACLHRRSKERVRCRLCKRRVVDASSWTLI